MTPEASFHSGQASEASSIPVAAAGKPGAPQGLTAASVSVSEIDLAFNEPTLLNKAPLIHYRISVVTTLGSDTSCVIDGNSVPFINDVAICVTENLTPAVDGLTENQAYTFEVQAKNSKGYGPAATVTQSTFSTADAPWDPRVFFPAGNEMANVGPAIAVADMTEVGTAGTNTTVLNVGIGGNVSSNLTQQPRTDTGASAASGASFISDTAIQADDVERVVLNTGTSTSIPPNTYVGIVTVGSGFTLVDITGATVETTGSVSGIELGSHISGWNIDPAFATTVASTTLSAAIPVTTRTDSTGVSSSGSTVTDPAILSTDLGRQLVGGTNVPSGCYVGEVTAGASFELVDGTGTAVTPTASITSVVLGAAPISQITVPSLNAAIPTNGVIQISTEVGGETIVMVAEVTAAVAESGSTVNIPIGIAKYVQSNQAVVKVSGSVHAGEVGDPIVPSYAFPVGSTVTFAPSINYVSSVGGTNAALGPTGNGWGQGGGTQVVATMSDCRIAAPIISSNGSICFRRCQIIPNQQQQVVSQNVGGSGGALSGTNTLDHCWVQSITDGSDPGGDYVARYTLYQAQKPESISGWLYNGGLPGSQNAVQPYYVSGAYIIQNAETLATRSPLVSPAGTALAGQYIPYTGRVDAYQPDYVYEDGDLATIFVGYTNNHYSYECIQGGVADDQATSTTSFLTSMNIPVTAYGDLTSSAYMPGYTAGDTINGIAETTTQQKTLPQPFIISGGVAIGVDPATYNGPNAVWVCNGGKPHCDGLQWEAGCRANIKNCYIQNADNSPTFMQCNEPTGKQPITGNLIDGCLINGGANKWALIQYTTPGPKEADDAYAQFNASGNEGYKAGLYLSTSGSWENIPVGKGSTAGVGNTRPRAIKYRDCWWGPQADGNTFVGGLGGAITDDSGATLYVYEGTPYLKANAPAGAVEYNEHIVFIGPTAANWTEEEIDQFWFNAIQAQYSYTFSEQDQANIIAGIFDWNAFDFGPTGVAANPSSGANLNGAVIVDSVLNDRLAIFAFPGMCDARGWIRVVNPLISSKPDYYTAYWNAYYAGQGLTIPSGTLADNTLLVPNFTYGTSNQYGSNGYYTGP